MMSRYSHAPRQGHLEAMIRLYNYVKLHLNSHLLFDTEKRDYSNLQPVEHEWGEYYPDAEEELPPNMPEALGESVQITFFVDADHASDLVTWRSTTGIIIFINVTPVKWYSKWQNTIKSSTYGSEFVALKIATEMVSAMRYKLRMLGMPVDGPAWGFCDNASVVTNSTIPSSVLKKKHNAIAYHKVRESIAAKSIVLMHEPGETNLADILTKTLNGRRLRDLIGHILF